MNHENIFIEANLPKTLTKKQIYDYLEKYKQGDIEARKKVIVHNIRLVLYEVYKKFDSTPYDKKELVSIGMIGLIKSVDTFDIEKNFQFITYASKCIDNEILMFMKKEKKCIGIESLNDILFTDKDGNNLKLEDVLKDDTINFVSDYEEQDSYREIRKVIQTLPDRDRKIIMLYYGFINNQRYTQKEIANSLNISQSQISRLINKIVKRVGNQFKNNDVIETMGQVIKKENIVPQAEIKDITDKQLENNDKALEKGVKRKVGKKLRSIYEYFSDYTKEQIDEILLNLTEEEKQLITLRYGNDLENPISSKSWGQEENIKFYGKVIPKMKRILSNPNRIRKISQHKVSNVTNNQEINTLEKEDYKGILEMLRTSSFEKLISEMSIKEAVIVSLKLGYIDGKVFSTNAIASFLKIEKEEVVKTTRKVLLVYKEEMNQFIDNALEFATDQKIILKKKND